MRKDAEILGALGAMWSVEQDQLIQQGEKFFKQYKKYKNKVSEQEKKLFALELRCLLSEEGKCFKVAT